jgi:predicted site-specific integrase-resolvase
VVLNRKETSPQEELVNDLISIITVFSSRLYGLRSSKLKNKIREQAEGGKKDKDIEI